MKTNTKKTERKVIMTPEFRVSFPHLFEPMANMQGKLKYSCVMLFDKNTDLSALKRAVHETAVAEWGPDTSKWPKGMRKTFRDGAEKKYEGYENTVFCTASSLRQPGIVDQNLTPILTTKDFYAGCRARATVVPFAYSQLGNCGVGLALNNLQKLRDDAPFSGRTKPEKDFEPVATQPVDAKAVDKAVAENFEL